METNNESKAMPAPNIETERPSIPRGENTRDVEALYSIPRRNREILSTNTERTTIRPSPEANYIPKTLSERVADLEIRVFKLWDMLIERSLYSRKEKLTKTGKEVAKKLPWLKD